MLKNGTRVRWVELSGLNPACEGYIVCNCSDSRGNPTDFYTIDVDPAFYNRACRTASEMSSGWVDRSAEFCHIRKLV